MINKIATARKVTGSVGVTPTSKLVITRVSAKEAAEKALRIDEQIAQAYAMRAVVRLVYEFDWPVASKISNEPSR